MTSEIILLSVEKSNLRSRTLLISSLLILGKLGTGCFISGFLLPSLLLDSFKLDLGFMADTGGDFDDDWIDTLL